MNVKNPLPIETFTETLHALWKLGILMFAVGSTFFTIIWFFARNDIQPFLDLPRQIERVSERIETIEERIGNESLVEFLPGPQTFPEAIRPGGNISITYQTKRNYNCPTTVTRRYYSIDRGGYDARFRSTEEAIRAPVTKYFAPFTITFPVPNLPAGRWGYAPELSPSGDCEVEEAVYPPIAYFTVEEWPARFDR